MTIIASIVRRLLLPLLVLLAFEALPQPPRAQEGDELLRRFMSFGDALYEIVVKESDLDGTPGWREEQTCPPLAPKRALSVAAEALRRFVPNVPSFRVRSIELMPLGTHAQWIYLIHFELSSGSLNEAPTLLSVPVLMSGRPIEAKRVEQSKADFHPALSLTEIPLAQALQLYRMLAGGPQDNATLVVDDDVPLMSRITGSSTSGMSTEEVLRLLDRAFREQAGVIVTPEEGKQFHISVIKGEKKHIQD